MSIAPTIESAYSANAFKTSDWQFGVWLSWRVAQSARIDGPDRLGQMHSTQNELFPRSNEMELSAAMRWQPLILIEAYLHKTWKTELLYCA